LRRPPRWALAVYAAALLARLAFVFLADEPLLYTHQYHYFTNALRIAEHPDPVRYVLASEEWRTWDRHWTIAPLYHLFAAAVFRLFGPHLLALRLVQCALEAAAAVGVASLARRAAGPRGAWAGIAYAVYWPAVEMPSWTMTENLHTPLLVIAVALLAREPLGARAALTAGVLLGLGALTRSVTAGFLGLAVCWLAWRALRSRAVDRRGAWPALLPAALLAAGGAAMILPWTARNAFIIGDPVLIETTAFENIWFANRFVDRERFLRQEQIVHGQPTPAAKRAAALRFAWRGVTRRPGMFVDKVNLNFWHFLRPEGLQNLLRVQRSQEGWRHLGSLLLDDPLLVACLAPLLVFVVAGRGSPARTPMLLWLGYYLLMVIVVFHNEIRYRSAFIPFAFAGAAGGVAALGRPGRRRAALAAFGAGLVLVLAVLAPFAGLAWRALRAAGPTRDAAASARAGAHEAAWHAAGEAARRDPGSARPWMELGSAFAHAAQPAAALAAYDRGAALATGANYRAVLAQPRLLAESGRAGDATRALLRAHRLSWNTDPWLLLEVAWRELPAPRTDDIVVGGDDYGAVRGFFHPRGDPALSAHRLEWNRYGRPGEPVPPPGTHRWSRARATLRLLPTRPASAYDVRLFMGSPFPSRLEAPEVTVRASGAGPVKVRLGREIAAHDFRARVNPGQPVYVHIEAPTWNRAGEPADQGVRVEKVQVQPAAGSGRQEVQ
jgi:4-amino-4-deoxy-L-arabinose transferase-like glycosyltransferase